MQKRSAFFLWLLVNVRKTLWTEYIGLVAVLTCRVMNKEVIEDQSQKDVAVRGTG